MDILLNRLIETIELLKNIEILISRINNINRTKHLEITKLRVINEISKIENALIDSKNTNKVRI